MKKENKRKEKNTKLQANWVKAVKLWEAECDASKAEKRRPRWLKPKRGKLIPQLSRPRARILRMTDDAALTGADSNEDKEELSDKDKDAD